MQFMVSELPFKEKKFLADGGGMGYGVGVCV